MKFQFCKPCFIRFCILVITILHIVGIWGILQPSWQEYFLLLTPVHLGIVVVLVLVNQEEWNDAFLTFVVVAFLLGYLMEVLSVHTGFPFGHYQYGAALGSQLFGVPLMIGINWLLLNYSVGATLQWISMPNWLKSILGAGLLVALDLLIEPLAGKLDFWYWQENMVPPQNYLGWFIVSLLIQLCYHYNKFEKTNWVASIALGFQFIFFISLIILLP